MKDKFNREKRRNWFERLLDRVGKEKALEQSKHSRGKRRPNGWRRYMRNARKAQRQARKSNR